jgi:hypothetical protein
MDLKKWQPLIPCDLRDHNIQTSKYFFFVIHDYEFSHSKIHEN